MNTSSPLENKLQENIVEGKFTSTLWHIFLHFLFVCFIMGSGNKTPQFIHCQKCHPVFMVHVCCRWLQLHVWKISFKKHSVREVLQYVVTHFLPFLFVCFIWASENKALLYSHKAQPAAKSFKVVYRTNTVYTYTAFNCNSICGKNTSRSLNLKS